MNELERVALLARIFAGGVGSDGLRVGIGDDAAVMDAPASPLVWTVDACVEGTHFRREWLSWEDVGWKSLMAAASDLAAMAAEPLGVLSSLVLGPGFDDAALGALARGQASAARALGTRVVGGNLARGEQTSITTTVLGVAERPILRGGASPGQLVLAAGPLGHAAAGLEAIREGASDEAAWASAWRRPVARLAEGRPMRAAGATAAIDVSDGLTRDAAHLARASGVRIVLLEAALRSYGVAIEHVLAGGEDYALLATARGPIDGFVEIGRVERGEGLALASPGGTVSELAERGFDHFA